MRSARMSCFGKNTHKPIGDRVTRPTPEERRIAEEAKKAQKQNSNKK